MKNIIERQCRGCKKKFNRELLIKITLNNNNLYINPDSKITGRSVYVCNCPDCILSLIKQKGIKRGLKFNMEDKIKEVETILVNGLN